MALVGLALAGCGTQTAAYDRDCVKGDMRCEGGFSYACREDYAGNHYWQVTGECVNGCDEEQIACFCHVACVNGCDSRGACACVRPCLHGCGFSGACLCPESCANGCDENGACLCPESCVNGCDANTGGCLCPSVCGNRCSPDGQCLPDTYEISASSRPIQLYVDTTTILPVRYLRNGAEANDIAHLTTWADDAQCVTVKQYADSLNVMVRPASMEPCVTALFIRDADGRAETAGLVVTVRAIDANGNRLHDQYESGPRLGEPCRTHADCDSAQGRGDGFCDSAIGYQCAARCTADSQCLQSGTGDRYVCRPDGRCTPDAFVTEWNIPRQNYPLTIPAAFAQNCDFTVDWGDGTQIETYTSCRALEHTYVRRGRYRVTIKGSYDNWSLSPDGDATETEAQGCLEDVISFGRVGLGPYAFVNTTNLYDLSDVDIPDASKMPSLRSAFRHSGIMGPLANWDTSLVTDMSGMFEGVEYFNQPLDSWDVSSVRNMSAMFRNTGFYDKDLRGWDTGRVKTMESMFEGAAAFNRPLGEWNVSGVTNLKAMFKDAASFNQNLTSWTIAEGADTSDMFRNAGLQNATVCAYSEIPQWREILTASGVADCDY